MYDTAPVTRRAVHQDGMVRFSVSQVRLLFPKVLEGFNDEDQADLGRMNLYASPDGLVKRGGEACGYGYAK